MMDEATKLLRVKRILNIYKNHMMTSLRALDIFNNVNVKKNCNNKVVSMIKAALF